jgi:hypothetical protein
MNLQFPKAPLSMVSSTLLIALDGIWGMGELASMGLAIPVLALSIFAICSSVITLVQRYIEGDAWETALSKGLACGVIAGLPFPVFGTAAGVGSLGLSTLNLLTSGSEGPPTESLSSEEARMKNLPKPKTENTTPEPYQPDYSPALGGNPPPYANYPPPPPSRGPGAFGCLRDSFALLLLAIVLLALGGGAYWYLTIREAGDTTENVVDNFLDRIFGDGSKAPPVINVNQLVLAVRQEAWLETSRETHSLDVYAEIPMPSPLPGTRSMRYKALVTVTGGIDLELVSEADFQTSEDGQTLFVTLPNAQLRDCILDSDASLYYDESCNYVGCGNLRDLLRDEALKASATYQVERIQGEAFESAAEYMEDFLEDTLESVGAGGVSVVIQRDSTALPTVSEGGTCYMPPPPPTPTPSP